MFGCLQEIARCCSTSGRKIKAKVLFWLNGLDFGFDDSVEEQCKTLLENIAECSSSKDKDLHTL